MSHTYRLVDQGYASFKHIMCGTKRIGEVKHVDNAYYGIIGKVMHKAPTEAEAFNEVVARYCGYANYDAMAARNSRVRTVRTRQRREAQQAVDALVSGDFLPLDKLLKRL